jgi:hypothetical protein
MTKENKKENKIAKPLPLTLLPPLQHLFDCMGAVDHLLFYTQFIFVQNVFTQQNFDQCIKAFILIESKLNQWILALNIYISNNPDFYNNIEQLSNVSHLLEIIKQKLNLLAYNWEIMRIKAVIQHHNALQQLYFISENSRTGQDFKPKNHSHQNFGFQ